MAPNAPSLDLSGQVVVVTGGSRGLGRSIAEAAVSYGANVAICGRSTETLDAAAAEMARQGGIVFPVVCDMARESDVERFKDQVLARFGRIDGLVNNAGINPYYKKAERTSLSEWQEIIDVNLTGVFLASRAFGSLMLESGGGSIVNVTSIGGHVGLDRAAAYCAAKGGVELMCRSLALDWASQGVRVNCLAPGYAESDLTHDLRQNAALRESLLRRIPQGRFAMPADIAGAAIFLLSKASSYMTGQTIVVDGGWTAI